jgi:NarL family two-component system sensor histidine kinase LiaS
MRRTLSSFRKLRWKLTFTYMLVTVAALLIIEIALITFLVMPTLSRPNPWMTDIVQSMGRGFAVEMQSYLARTPTDRQAISQLLQRIMVRPYLSPLESKQLRSNSPANPGGLVILVVDSQAQIVATLPEPADAGLIGSPLDTQTAPELAPLAAIALAGNESLEQGPSGYVRSATPIKDNDGHVVGAIVIIMDIIHGRQLSLAVIGLVMGGSLLIFTLIAGFIGIVFSTLAMRGISRRLGRLARASNSWKQGNFSVNVNDRSDDELGQLAQDFNRMAADLHSLMQTRQELAALEERNRLARDLHDSIKQQAFAVSAQLSAARKLLHRDPSKTEERLEEAERLSEQLRQELSALVRELLPLDVLHKGLAASLQEYTSHWSSQNNIPVELQTQAINTPTNEASLPSEVQLALFRVAQEALSNVARHSQAKAVQIHLNLNERQVCLSIADNGQGFDPQNPLNGFGLRSMRERLSALNGQLSIESAVGKGTTVQACCPAVFQAPNGAPHE